MIELNREYTYKQICEELGWKIQTSNSRKCQIKSIESSFEFYHPINNKTHKEKKSYIFTKQLKQVELIDCRKFNGSNIHFDSSKFNYLLYCILKKGLDRNIYDQRGINCSVYISNTTIYEEFGFPCYKLLNELPKSKQDLDGIVYDLFKNIVKESIKSKTITKICKIFNYNKNSIPKGILRQETKYTRLNKRPRIIPDDSLLDTYNDFQRNWIKEHDLNNIGDVVNNGLYNDMSDSINDDFEKIKKYGVIKLNKIELQDSIRKEILEFNIDTELKEKYQKEFKDYILEVIHSSIENRINNKKDYKFKIDNKQKIVLEKYYEIFKEIDLEKNSIY